MDGLDPREAVLAATADVAAGATPGTVAARFHNGLAAATARALAEAAGGEGAEAAALSGGVFQNRHLLEGVALRLRRAGLRVLVPERLPPNDGGISYGQAAAVAGRRRLTCSTTSRSAPPIARRPSASTRPCSRPSPGSRATAAEVRRMARLLPGRRRPEAPVTRGLHVGFGAPSREAVDAFWRAGVEAGYRDDGPPGPRPEYGPDYYAAFLLDPDGNSAEAVRHARVAAGVVVDHLWIRTADLAASAAFYDAIAHHAGFARSFEGPSGCGSPSRAAARSRSSPAARPRAPTSPSGPGTTRRSTPSTKRRWRPGTATRRARRARAVPPRLLRRLRARPRRSQRRGGEPPPRRGLSSKALRRSRCCPARRPTGRRRPSGACPRAPRSSPRRSRRRRGRHSHPARRGGRLRRADAPAGGVGGGVVADGEAKPEPLATLHDLELADVPVGGDDRELERVHGDVRRPRGARSRRRPALDRQDPPQATSRTPAGSTTTTSLTSRRISGCTRLKRFVTNSRAPRSPSGTAAVLVHVLDTAMSSKTWIPRPPRTPAPEPLGGGVEIGRMDAEGLDDPAGHLRRPQLARRRIAAAHGSRPASCSSARARRPTGSCRRSRAGRR